METLLTDNHESITTNVFCSLKVANGQCWTLYLAADMFNTLITSSFPSLQELLVLLPGQVLLNGGLSTLDDSSVAFFSRSTVSRCILMQKYKLQCTIIQRQGSLLELGHFCKSVLHQCCTTSTSNASYPPCPASPPSLTSTLLKQRVFKGRYAWRRGLREM